MIKKEIERRLKRDAVYADRSEEDRLEREYEARAFRDKVDYYKTTLPAAARRGALGTVMMTFGTNRDGEQVLETIRFPGEETSKTVEELVRDGSLRRRGIT